MINLRLISLNAIGIKINKIVYLSKQYIVRVHHYATYALSVTASRNSYIIYERWSFECWTRFNEGLKYVKNVNSCAAAIEICWQCILCT